MKPEYIYLIIFALLIILIAVSVVVVRRLMQRMTDKKIESYQSDLLNKYYDEVENMYRQMRGWRHDYRNHIQSMKIYLSLDQLDELSAYLDSLADDLNSIDTMLKTGNVMADAILNSKLSLAQSKGIDISAAAKIPPEIPLSGTDLCVILGNLLDNAIEACEKIENTGDRFIRVYIGKLKSQLYISVSNSADGQMKKVGGDYRTTKNGNHGFGLKRVDLIVERHAGYINRQDEGDVFATEVMLPLI